MIGIRIRRAGRNQERSVRRGGGRYAIADGLCVLLTVEALTEAARRQWPTKKIRFSGGWESGILVEAMRRKRGRPSELDGSAAAVCNYPGWITFTMLSMPARQHGVPDSRENIKA